jgi:hypothetical protein
MDVQEKLVFLFLEKEVIIDVVHKVEQVTQYR